MYAQFHCQHWRLVKSGLDDVTSASITMMVFCLDNAPGLVSWKLISEVVLGCVLDFSARVVIVRVRYFQGYGRCCT